MLVLIGTPAYGCQIHIDYLNTIMSFIGSGLKLSTLCIGNESLITRARNNIVSYFNENKQYTHLLFLDADIGLPAHALAKLLEHNKDVVGVPVCLKGFSGERSVLNISEPLERQGDLTRVTKVGTGVLLLSRKAIDELVKNSEYFVKTNVSRGESFVNVKVYDVFKTGIYDGNYLSEDFYLCRKLIELGFDIFVDTSITTIHNGNYPFVYTKEMI